MQHQAQILPNCHALGLVYSAVEYFSPVWFNSPHTRIKCNNACSKLWPQNPLPFQTILNRPILPIQNKIADANDNGLLSRNPPIRIAEQLGTNKFQPNNQWWNTQKNEANWAWKLCRLRVKVGANPNYPEANNCGNSPNGTAGYEKRRKPQLRPRDHCKKTICMKDDRCWVVPETNLQGRKVSGEAVRRNRLAHHASLIQAWVFLWRPNR